MSPNAWTSCYAVRPRDDLRLGVYRGGVAQLERIKYKPI